MDLLPLKSQGDEAVTMPSTIESTQQSDGGRLFRSVFRFCSGATFLGSHKIYIPYRPFQVRIVNRNCEHVHCFAVDSVTGTLDLRCLEPSRNDHKRTPLKPEHVLLSCLSIDRQRGILLDQVRRHVYLSGFFGLHKLRIDAQLSGPDILCPYWVEIYRKNDRITINVIDMDRKMPEGAKLRALILDWLKEQPPSYWDQFHMR